jgi:hypothetical protein
MTTQNPSWIARLVAGTELELAAVALHKHERHARRDGAAAQDDAAVRRLHLLLREALQRGQLGLEQPGAADEADRHHLEAVGRNETRCTKRGSQHCGAGACAGGCGDDA